MKEIHLREKGQVENGLLILTLDKEKDSESVCGRVGFYIFIYSSIHGWSLFQLTYCYIYMCIVQKCE